MLNNIFLKTMRDFFYLLIYFSIGIFLLAIIVMFVVAELPLDEFQEIMGNLPEIMTAFIAGHGGLDLTSVEGVLNTDVFTIIAPVIVIGLGIYSGISATAQEEESKTLDIVLSVPIKRKRFLGDKIFSLITKILIVGLIFWISFVVSAFMFGLNLSTINLAAICVNLSLLGISFGLLTVMIGTITSNTNVAFFCSFGVGIISYLIFTLAPLFSKISFTKYLSLFYYYKGSDPLVNGFHAWHWTIFISLIVFLFWVSIYKWEIKDLS